MGCGKSGTWESLAETHVLHLQTMTHLLQELLLHHSSVEHHSTRPGTQLINQHSRNMCPPSPGLDHKLQV